VNIRIYKQENYICGQDPCALSSCDVSGGMENLRLQRRALELKGRRAEFSVAPAKLRQE
jgi:hypothetical protein